MKGRRIASALREAMAMARQFRYLSFDLAPQVRDGPGPVVFLLHGLYASAGVFRPLGQQLRLELDAAVSSFSYPPGPGILELAQKLKEQVAQFVGERPIHLVGHSLGGLVVRYYASSPECDPRVAQTISLAAPFLGSKRNFLVPGTAGRDIEPGAPILAQLRAASAANQSVPHRALVAQDDEMIEPGAYPDFGRHALVPNVGHNGILFNEEAMRLVVDAIRRPRGVQGGLIPL
jgi:pimeloyl-ACP methyl ester carboxylesterase